MSWKRICEVERRRRERVKKFDVDGVPILIMNYGSGFRAIPPICPHMEEPLEESGVVVRCILTCTKHLWAWDLSSLDMQGETEKPLKTYEIKQENGAILVNIEQELVYEFEDEDDMTTTTSSNSGAVSSMKIAVQSRVAISTFDCGRPTSHSARRPRRQASRCPTNARPAPAAPAARAS